MPRAAREEGRKKEGRKLTEEGTQVKQDDYHPRQRRCLASRAVLRTPRDRDQQEGMDSPPPLLGLEVPYSAPLEQEAGKG